MSDSKDIFSNTGNCPGTSKLLDYLEGKLSKGKAFQIEKHLADCPLCSDELEGLQAIGNRELYQGSLTEINKKIEIVYGKNQNRRLKFMRVAAAASIILALTITGGLYFYLPDKNYVAEKPGLPVAGKKDSKLVQDVVASETVAPVENETFSKRNAQPIIQDVISVSVVEDIVISDVDFEDVDYEYDDSYSTTDKTLSRSDSIQAFRKSAGNEDKAKAVIAILPDNKTTAESLTDETISNGSLLKRSGDKKEEEESKHKRAETRKSEESQMPAKVDALSEIAIGQIKREEDVSGRGYAVVDEGFKDDISELQNAIRLFDSGQLDSASIGFHKLITSGSDDGWDARIFLARIAIIKNNRDDARGYLKTIIDLAPQKFAKQAKQLLESIKE